MQATDKSAEIWETQQAVRATCAKAGVSDAKLARWRHEGLLPAVAQTPTAYHGSTVNYPPGTCAQIEAAARLFKRKSLTSWVGWQLWWEGYAVDDKYWRPLLVAKARLLDRGLAQIGRYLIKDEKEPAKKTLQERMAESESSNIVMSRIKGRQSGAALATTFAVVLRVSTGEFDQFSISDDIEGDNAENRRTNEALDIGAAETDLILGKRLELVQELPNVYATISRAFASGSVSQALMQPNDAISLARSDARNCLRIYVAQYDAMAWIYGPTAFGLRLGAWIGRKQPDWLMPLMILGFARLRQSSDMFLPSEEIGRLADQAEANALMSQKIKYLGMTDPRFKNVFSAKAMRASFASGYSRDRHTEQICHARDGFSLR